LEALIFIVSLALFGMKRPRLSVEQEVHMPMQLDGIGALISIHLTLTLILPIFRKLTNYLKPPPLMTLQKIAPQLPKIWMISRKICLLVNWAIWVLTSKKCLLMISKNVTKKCLFYHVRAFAFYCHSNFKLYECLQLNYLHLCTAYC